MASELSIISGAAIRLGEPPVVSLTEDTKTARTGSNLYDTVLEATLSANRWRFAVGQAQLTLLAAVPVEGFQYAYQLPTNPKVVTIIRVWPNIRYERYEDRLFCDSGAGLTIDYVFRPDESRFPAYFVELMELRMAAAMAIPVTGSRTLKDSMQADLVGNQMQPGVLATAMAADARERPGQSIVDSPFLDVRR